MKKQSVRVFLVAGAALIATSLQGCFPLIAAGVGAGAMSISDRRSTGAQIDDEAIEAKISSRNKEQFGSAQYEVDATSYNRRVLLTGQAATEEIKNRLADIAKSVPNVAAVFNEVTVADSNSFGKHSNDALVTSNVKARLVTNAEGRFHASDIKVTTESNTVYLMGLVTQAEGDAATEVARTSQGVQRVVKVFEYTDNGRQAGAVK